MARVSFPFELDRLAMLHFLMGGAWRAQPGQAGDDGIECSLASADGKLLDGNDRAAAWFAPDGTLWAMRDPSSLIGTERAFNWLLEQLGDDQRVERQPRQALTEALTLVYRDQMIPMGHPFVLAGPMTVMAYRASANQPDALHVSWPARRVRVSAKTGSVP